MKTWKALLAIAVLAGTAAAHAHESTGRKAGPVHKEQKAFGIAGDARAVTRTIRIAMSDDMRFTPNGIEVGQGETIRFVVANRGKVLHELVIGTRKELDEHAALMARFPNMEHEEPHMAHVKPGGTGEVVWNFNRPGTFNFACLVAGHYQAGMVGTIIVKRHAAHKEGHKP